MKMENAKTIPAKYVFLDVVGFTHNRSVEAQSEIVHALNDIVDFSIAEVGLDKSKLILLPTGDGLCVGLLNIEEPYDIHVQLALTILRLLDDRNGSTDDATRKFEVRIAINSNTDNLVTDINGRPNLAGAGINMAARILSKADGNQILIGDSVYDTLVFREKYMHAFKSHQMQVKHGVELRMHQLVSDGLTGLNTECPEEWRPKDVPKSKRVDLTRYVAYYLAHAILNRDFIMTRAASGQNNYSLTVLLHFLTSDSLGKSDESPIDRYTPWIYGNGTLDLSEVFTYYQSVNFRVICEFCQIPANELRPFGECFELGKLNTVYSSALFPSKLGLERLRIEQPNIYEEMGLFQSDVVNQLIEKSD